MKIALVIDALKTGGAERQIILSATELTKLGHDVSVIVYHPSETCNDYIDENNDVVLVNIHKKGLTRLGRVRALHRHFSQSRYDVIHAFGGGPTINVSFVARWAGAKPVFGGFRNEYRSNWKMRIAHHLANMFIDGLVISSGIPAIHPIKNWGN